MRIFEKKRSVILVCKSLAIHLNHYSSQQTYVCVECLREGLGASLGSLMIETIMKNDCQKQIVHFLFGRIRWPDTCESALTSSPHAMLTDGMVL